jgi:hypothetical protein
LRFWVASELERRETVTVRAATGWAAGVADLPLLACSVAGRGLGRGALILGDAATAQESVLSK